MILYEIANWDKHFEVAQNRRCKGPLQWVATPTTHDGKGYRRTAAQQNNCELFAAWCLILQVGAKCEKRGVLADKDGVPLDSEDLSAKTGFPIAAFDAALKFFSRDKIGWLISSQYCETPSKEGNAPSKAGKSRILKPHSTVQDITDIERESIRAKVGEKYAEDVLRVMLAREGFQNLIPEHIATEIHKQENNPNLKENLQNFIADVANMTEPPKSPLAYLRRYLSGTNGGNGGGAKPKVIKSHYART